MEIIENVKNARNYDCSYCLFISCNKTDYTRHISTLKHKKRIFGNVKNVKNVKNVENIENVEKYECSNCLFISSNKTDYNIHITTLNHQKEMTNLEIKNKTLYCNCGKQFKTNNGFWKHNKKCNGTTQPIYATNEQKQQLFTDEMFMALINQNKELQTLLLEQQKMVMDQSNKICSFIQIPTNNNTMTNNINNNNSHNTFNLQVFLNETCKNAMNLTDFVNSLNVTIADLEETGRLGFSDGITKIIVKGLKDLDVTERPIHCTDAKRETIYVKEENIWQKDDNHEKLTKAIKQVSHKNTKNIMEWQKLNPEYSDSNSKQSSRFNKLLLNVMSGGTIEEQQGNVTKVVKNISREVVLNKGAMVVV